ncbi:unnamed protein product [Caenorhabditis angaria]|uniref:Glycosyltransferase family 92 protein n=1 Tax=Caenorhabditis angaria TaxID=860376 RepID=A0A9P1IIC5_9PELO|nr:unnamed protein product [Caenorhabditis angaria]
MVMSKKLRIDLTVCTLALLMFGIHIYLTMFFKPEKYNSNKCFIDDWNRITLGDIPHAKQIKLYGKEGLTIYRMDTLLGGQLRLVNSFVYPDHIAVTTTVQHSQNDNITCVYFDCNRKEIVNTRFKSIYYPYNIVLCARRYGAEYISLDLEDGNKIPEPIPMIYRIYKEPIHEISVCVGPIFGNESKWLGIAEYMEHYKLIGVNHFYFTVFDINEYDRKILNDYIRLGEVELTELDTEYKKEDWQMHMVQQGECLQRAKFHSKWVINADFDERLVLKNNNTIQDILYSEKSATEYWLSVARVLKNETMPEKYINSSQTEKDMQFIKHHMTLNSSFFGSKPIFRSDIAAKIYFHRVIRHYDNQEIVRKIDPEIAYIRHYRDDNESGINSGWNKNGTEFVFTDLDEEFSRKLVENVLKRVEYVYNEKLMYCDEIGPTFLRYKIFKDSFDCIDRT